ncbi:MAG: zinc-dependent metalloprotease [Flavitalea sp.]
MFTLSAFINRFTFRTANTVAMCLLLFYNTATAQIPKLNSNIAAPATVYLDFDGETVAGTAWNWDSTIHAKPSGLKTAQITEVFNRVAEDYSIFNINITTDASVYAKAPVAKRVRIIITPTSKWYGIAGGISFVGSFTWGDNTPSWVFVDVLQYNSKYIGEATSHEAGHTLGLQHQSTYNSKGILTTEYAEGKGEGEISWAPIMGLSYYKNLTTWNIGSSIEGAKVIQNDVNIISNGENHIGLRPDDYGNTRQTAATLPLTGNAFSGKGDITTAADKDVFKIVLQKNSLFHTKVVPNNVGPSNSGANLDIRLSLLRENGDTIGNYNPKTVLSASIDTNLRAGTYYIVIDGVGNQNTPDYHSVGYYNISGTLQAVLPIIDLSLQGKVQDNAHLIHWTFTSDEPVKSSTIEVSSNGRDFTAIATLAANVTTYKNVPFGNGQMYYRIRMETVQLEEPVYSNVIALQYSTRNNISLNGNRVHSVTQVSVAGNYSYDLVDMAGKLYQRGKLVSGVNSIALNSLNNGLFLLRVYDGAEQQVFRLMKQ